MHKPIIQGSVAWQDLIDQGYVVISRKDYDVMASQIASYEETKPIMHWYVTAYARQKAALEMIAQQRDGRNAETHEEAIIIAKEALRYAEDQE